MNPREVATVPDSGNDDDPELPSRLGHFDIVGRLGAGGMGLVFEGRDTVLDRRVALKLLHPGRVGNPIAPARLLREAQALAKPNHILSILSGLLPPHQVIEVGYLNFKV